MYERGCLYKWAYNESRVWGFKVAFYEMLCNLEATVKVILVLQFCTSNRGHPT